MRLAGFYAVKTKRIFPVYNTMIPSSELLRKVFKGYHCELNQSRNEGHSKLRPINPRGCGVDHLSSDSYVEYQKK